MRFLLFFSYWGQLKKLDELQKASFFFFFFLGEKASFWSIIELQDSKEIWGQDIENNKKLDG